jgi:membrane protein insertase Oxa1/YidC/SpoIIIJ
VQFYQSKQLAPNDKDARGLRAILRDAKSGKQADQQEINAAMARSTRYLLPALVFLFTIHLPSALSLYWLTSGIVAFIQQSYALREDTVEMEAEADKPDAAKRAKQAIEAEIVDKPKPAAKKKAAARKKRRK